MLSWQYAIEYHGDGRKQSIPAAHLANYVVEFEPVNQAVAQCWQLSNCNKFATFLNHDAQPFLPTPAH